MPKTLTKKPKEIKKLQNSPKTNIKSKSLKRDSKKDTKISEEKTKQISKLKPKAKTKSKSVTPRPNDKETKKPKSLDKAKLKRGIENKNKQYLDTIGDRHEVMNISSDKLAKLMGDVDSRKALIKKYGKTRLKYEMYLDRILYLISKGGKIRKTGTVNKDSFQISSDRIYTYDSIIKIWAIEQTPELLETDFELELKANFIENFPDCELLIKEVHVPYFINFESDDIIYHLDYWAKQANKISNDEADTKDDFVRTLLETNAKFRRRAKNKRMISSFLKIKQYQKEQFLFNRVYKFVYVYAPTESRLDDCADYIESMHSDFTVTLIKNSLPQFLKTFGSASMQDHPLSMRSIDTQIQSVLDTAQLTPYEQGTVGDTGVCVGIDIETNLPVNIPTTEDAKGKTILITAPAGEGKSAEAKGIAYFHKINRDRIVFMDYEGAEYDGFIKKYGGLKISQSLTESSCINTLVIGDCRNSTEEEAKYMMQRAKNSTSRIFKILYADNIAELESTDLSRLIDDAINYMYKNAQVEEGYKYTYHNSLNLKYHHLYEAIEAMGKGAESNKKYGDLIDKCLNRLHTYWSVEGSKKYLFENEVSFEEIFKADTLQLSFGMAEQKENTTDEKDMRLKYFNMEYIITEYAQYNRKNNLFTAVFIEELQRAATSPFLLRLYNHLITGGRKLNLTNYVITNSVLGLLDTKDQDAIAIRDNINILLIGNLKKNVRESIIDVFSLESIRYQIEQVATNPEYDYAFVLTYAKKRAMETAIVRMDLPDEIMGNSVFDTRTVKKVG